LDSAAASEAPPRRRRASRDAARPDRGPLIALAGAIAVATALILFETRDSALYNDEVAFYQGLANEFGMETVLTPRNGHLLAVATLLYELVFTSFGPDYLVLRIVDVLGLAALAVVLYAYLRRRLDPWLALAPVVVTLFLGASWETLLWPFSVATFVFALAAGIGALLLVERRDRGGDLAACGLLIFGLACHSIALPFVVGIAVMLLWRKRNRGRAWVFLVPLILYAAWWIWALKFESTSALDAVNVWIIPAYSAEALAAVLASITGLGATIGGGGLNPTIQIDSDWGQILAIVAVVALVVRLTRRRIPIALVATLAMLATYWTMAALSLGPERAPDESRYILPGAVLVFLVAANALSGVRIPPAARIAVLAVTVFAVATGVRQLHDGALFLRDYSLRAQATASGIEEAEASVPPGYEPRNDPSLVGTVPPQLPLTAGGYFEGRREFGPWAFTRRELAEQPEEIRAVADQVRIAAISAGAGVEPPE
jgi:hypothetical protein